MATIRKTPSATWKAVIRKRGWPTVIKTFRTKREAVDWARRTEDEMVRGVYIDRAASERLLLKKALDRYETDVCATKRPSTARREKPASANLKAKLGDYSLAAITPDIVAGYRDQRLAEGLSASTVRLELALLSHLYTVAIKEWRTGLIYNPVANIPSPPRIAAAIAAFPRTKNRNCFAPVTGTPIRCSVRSCVSRSTHVCGPARSGAFSAAR